jgi:hypothetical protein
MNHPTKHQTKAARAILGTDLLVEEHTVLIDCPVHKSQHSAVLCVYGHKYAGIWECQEGDSDVHDHQELEQVEMDSVGEGDYSRLVTVCKLCGIEVEE